jgi:hypothetical protein
VKRILIAAVVMAALGALLAWMTRREPSGSLLDGPETAFSIGAASPGWRVSFDTATTPLRSLHFLPPRQPGFLVAQAETQSDRQRVAVFKDGGLAAEFLVGRPQGAGDGFWRFARLADARVLPDATFLLLYRPGDPSSTEPSLLLATGADGVARWVHRGAFDRLALTPGGDPAALLYGAPGRIERLPLQSGPHPAPRVIEVPAELTTIEDLVATGPSTFLAAAPGTLWAYQDSKGWTSSPSPEAPSVPCESWHASLALAGRDVYWQPAPGRVVQVAQDGTLVAGHEITGMPDGDPQARDLRLMRLLGADAAGRLWFDLAQPMAQPSAMASTPPAGGDEALEDWGAYAGQGLDRVYRWTPGKATLERFAWSQAWKALAPPQGVAPGTPRLDPASGSFVLEGQGAGWWAPLASLPFAPCQAR